MHDFILALLAIGAVIVPLILAADSSAARSGIPAAGAADHLRQIANAPQSAQFSSTSVRRFSLLRAIRKEIRPAVPNATSVSSPFGR
jgi:hypothetical protein